MVNVGDVERLSNEGGYDWNKWGEFFIRWAEALETYGTPVQFIDGTKYEKSNLDRIGGYPVILKSGGNFDLRRELMKNQKKYESLSEPSSYGVRMDYDNCFLCQNIAQAFDAKASGDKRLDNIVADCGNYMMMPNRYPGSMGHSLWVPVNHDDDSMRVKPLPDETEKGRPALVPVYGKTRGAMLSVEELESLMEETGKYNLAAVRNHVLDGMSIPSHDHFHLFPEDNPSYSLIRDMTRSEGKSYTQGLYRMNDTPYDTLVLSCEFKDALAETVSRVLGNLEKDNVIFTLFYHDGLFAISPRYEPSDHRRIQIGAGIHVHSFDSQSDKFFDDVAKYVPRKGDFNWNRYLD